MPPPITVRRTGSLLLDHNTDHSFLGTSPEPVGGLDQLTRFRNNKPQAAAAAEKGARRKNWKPHADWNPEGNPFNDDWNDPPDYPDGGMTGGPSFQLPGGGSSSGGSTGGNTTPADHPHDYTNDAYNAVKDILDFLEKSDDPQLKKWIPFLKLLITKAHFATTTDQWEKLKDALDEVVAFIKEYQAFFELPEWLRWLEFANEVAMVLSALELLMKLWDATSSKDVVKAFAELVPGLWPLIKLMYGLDVKLGDWTEEQLYQWLRSIGYPGVY